MEEQLFQDCRALPQSATYDSNISDLDRVVVQPCLEYPADESTMEDNANAVDETNNAASPENVSSSDYAEATDDNWCSDTDSYIELYDNYDNKRESCEYEQDTVNDATLDDEDTFDVEDDSFEKEKEKKL
ncbi:hypothetical protein OUZ56_011548 [Daphnia magna]|uniref:Uncharacterized protein n=1 Tax=Daphnia magna TaxID=35525 RepID=A0ABQ9Z0F2_9CRUS|nr:hypothetical protein OUZ56_011548 [Daphnia magna]